MTTLTGPAKLHMSLSYMEIQQKSGLPYPSGSKPTASPAAHIHVTEHIYIKAYICVCVYLLPTCNDSRDSPANSIVESHGSIVDVSHFCLHAVNMQSFHKQPRKCRHEEVMEQNCNHRAQELQQPEIINHLVKREYKKAYWMYI